MIGCYPDPRKDPKLDTPILDSNVGVRGSPHPAFEVALGSKKLRTMPFIWSLGPGDSIGCVDALGEVLLDANLSCRDLLGRLEFAGVAKISAPNNLRRRLPKASRESHELRTSQHKTLKLRKYMVLGPVTRISLYRVMRR